MYKYHRWSQYKLETKLLTFREANLVLQVALIIDFFYFVLLATLYIDTYVS